MMFFFDVDFVPVARAFEALRGTLDDELERALVGVGEVVASSARADHPYADRTGRLTRSHRQYAPRGRFSRGSLAVEVTATAEYASYVADRKGDWLSEAFERQDGRIENDIENALRRAIQRADL